MSHILKYTEWQSPTGNWYANDVSDLAHGSGSWWHVPRMLQISLTDYILLLKNKYNATDFSYIKERNVLLWHWNNYNDCHKFILYINKEAKNRKFFI